LAAEVKEHVKNMKKSFKKWSLLAKRAELIALAAALPQIALAGPALDKVVCLIGKVADFVFAAALAVGVLFVLVGAFKYMTAAGDSSKVREAQGTLTYAVIGIAVALLAGSVPAVVSSLLGGGAPPSVPTGC